MDTRYIVDVAKNGKDAIKRVINQQYQHKKQYSIIIMDLNMPVMNGVEATKQLRKMNL